MIRIVPLTPELIEVLAPRIRQADRDELWAAHCRVDMRAALLEALAVSTEAFAAMAGDTPICAFGIAPMSLLGSQGTPWMLGTEEIRQHVRPFLDGSRVVVARWRQDWSLMVNCVDARNRDAIRWLRWLGFQLDDARPYGPFNLPFHRFEMRSMHV